MSAARGTSAGSDKHGRFVLGATLALVLGPVVVAAFGIALLSLIGALTGWYPELLRRTMPTSFYSGEAFTKARFSYMAAGFAIGCAAAIVIRWGIHGVGGPVRPDAVTTSTPTVTTPTVTTSTSSPRPRTPAPSSAPPSAEPPAAPPRPTGPAPASGAVDRTRRSLGSKRA